MRTIFFLFAFLMTYSFHYGQSNEFENISKSDLSQEFDKDFPEADAVVLSKKIDVKIESEPNGAKIKNTYIQERVKIFNRSGFDRAQKYMRLLNDKSIKNPQALTYNLINGEIVTNNFKKDSIVNNENNSEIKIYRYILSGLKEGCIIEFKYHLIEDCCSNFEIPLQENIPVKKITVNVSAPKHLKYRAKINSKVDLDALVEESTRVNDDYNYVSDNGYGAKANNQSITEDVFTLQFTNLPAVKEEPYAYTDIYKASIGFELNNSSAVNASMSNTSETLANNFITLLEAEANELKFTENEIHDVLKGNEDDLEKTIILFNFIKMKIKWNGLKGIEPLKGLENAYLSGSGNIADINLSLLKLLRSAGIDASPVLLNTRDSELKSELTNNEFNYIICSVNINDSQILLDASDDFSSPNTLPERALVKKGLIVEYNGNQKIINLVPVKPSNKLITINAKVHPDNSVKGSIKSNLTDYFALDFLENYSSISESEIIKEYERNYKGLNAYSYKHHIEYDFSNSITQSFQFSSDNLSNKSAGKLYITPLLFLANETNPFKDSYRQYPVDFKYPFNTEFKVNIIFPQDFEIESLPRNELLKLDELGAEFTYFLRSVGNVVELYMSLKQNKTIVAIEDYKKLREFYEAIHKKRKEVITLSINNYGSKRSSKNSK